MHLVGHDWGAAVAWATAAAHPDVVRTLTTVSVPHPAAFTRSLTSSDQARRSWYMLAFQPPLVAELLARARPDATGRFLRRAGMSQERSIAAGARSSSTARCRAHSGGIAPSPSRSAPRPGGSASPPPTSGATATPRSRGGAPSSPRSSCARRTSCGCCAAWTTGSRPTPRTSSLTPCSAGSRPSRPRSRVVVPPGWQGRAGEPAERGAGR